MHFHSPGERSRYSNLLRAGRSGGRTSVVTRFSALIQTGPGGHTASCAVVTESFFRVWNGQGVVLTTHPYIALRLKKE
jgi:hypothetical protein